METLTKSPLRRAREAHGWTQTELAERASVTRQTVYNLESGRKQPQASTARLLALALGVPREQLFPEKFECGRNSRTGRALGRENADLEMRLPPERESYTLASYLAEKE